MSRIGIWFWDELLPNHTYSMLCGFGYRFCFGVSRKPRGSFAEAPRKKHMPKQRYSLRMPSKTNERSKSKAKNESKWRPKRPKWKEMKPTTTRNRGKRSGAVVAEARTKKTRSRKLAEGLYVKCMSRKLALWSRKDCGRCCGSNE